MQSEFSSGMWRYLTGKRDEEGITKIRDRGEQWLSVEIFQEGFAYRPGIKYKCQ